MKLRIDLTNDEEVRRGLAILSALAGNAAQKTYVVAPEEPAAEPAPPKPAKPRKPKLAPADAVAPAPVPPTPPAPPVPPVPPPAPPAPAPEPEPEPEPAPAEPETEPPAADGPQPTLAELATSMQNYAKAWGGPEKLKEEMKKLGFSKATELDPSRYAEAIEVFSARPAEGS